MAILWTSATRSALIHKRILVLLAILFFAILVLPVAAEPPAGSPSTTTLSVSPTNASAGQVVTLTATVSNGDLVTRGTVTFSSRKQALGTVQLVQNGGAQGTATLKIRFAPGTYTLTAQFNGTSFDQPSQSDPQQLTVTGTEPTITTMTAKPDGSNYDFTASVFGFGFPAPTGTATFNDLTTMTNLGMVPIAGPGTLGFQLPASLPVGNVPEGIASGDFNGDGIADLAVTNSGDNTVSVLLGNGDGTFNAQQTYPVGGQPAGIAVGDFNGDGIADLAVPNASDNNVSVLLGNADGTFPQQNPTYGAGVMPFDIAVADFNGDGIADLAVTNSGEGTVSVLLGLGNGDGTFPQENPTYKVGMDPIGIAVADFNGDGCPDLAVTNLGDNTVSVLLGNVVNQECDGTFQPQQTYPAGVAPYGIAIADFNGDGIADLAVTNTTAATVSVLLGEGDGTFPQQNPPTYGVGEEPAGIAVADFNGDGFADLAVSSRQNATISVLLGKGDGAFQPQQAYGGGNIGIAVTDLNGDGVPDIAAVDNGPNTVSILLGGTVTSGPPLNVPVIGLNQTIQSTYTPNLGFYRRSLSNEVVVNGRISTTTKVTSSQNPSQFNQPVTFTATVNFNAPPVNFNVRPNDGGSPTGTVNFTDNGTIIAGCGAVQLVPQQNGGTATCQTSSLTVGSPQTIVATYGGGGNFAPSMGTLKPPQVVSKANTQTALTAVPPQQSNYQQLVTFTATVTGAFGGSPTGTVTFTDGTTPICTAVPLAQQSNGSAANCSTATLAVGGHTIAAAYNDDPNFSGSRGTIPYTVQDFSLLVSPAAVTVTQSLSNTNQPYFSQPINLTVQPLSGFGGTVTLSCSVNPTLVNGTCTVNPPTSGSLANGPLNSTLTINTDISTPIGSYTVTITAQERSGLVHSTTLALTVINYTPVITMVPDGGGGTSVTFPGPSGTMVGNLSCPLVTGTGITGSENPTMLGITCGFSTNQATLPQPVTLGIRGCIVTTRLTTPMRILAAFWLGMPAMVLLGSMRFRKLPRKKLLQMVATLLLLMALLMGVGCGGGSSSSSGGSTKLPPTGSYSLLVQGTDSSGTVYSAVVPITVGQ